MNILARCLKAYNNNNNNNNNIYLLGANSTIQFSNAPYNEIKLQVKVLISRH